MKKTLLITLLAMSIFFLEAQSKKDLKEIKDIFKDMVLIPTGKMLITGSPLGPTIPLAKDSNLLMSMEPCIGGLFTFNSSLFYLCNHEMTNAEYKKFIAWVRDSTAEKNAASTLYSYKNAMGERSIIDIMPDTSQWLKGPTKYYGDPLAEYYHNRLEFDPYPVVNVSQEQALAYIHWLNNRFAERLRNHGFQITSWGTYRLPTALEWEYAASYNGGEPLDVNQTDPLIYSWLGRKLTDDKGVYLGNFGNIIDENGMLVKSLYEDNYQNTAPSISYRPNIIGLYNMSGNVSEWTSTSTSTDSLKAFYTNCYCNILGKKYAFLLDEVLKQSPDWNLFQKYVEPKNALYFNPKNDAENRDMSFIIFLLKPAKQSENHNLKILSRLEDPVIVKGGSWADAPCYLQCSMNQAFSWNKPCSKVGFRVAMELSPELQGLIKGK